MLTYHTKEHDYFLSQVKITIEPNKEYNYTSCEVEFIPNGQKGGLDYSWKWWVDVDEYFENAKDALEELTKEKYADRGTSEA